MNMSEKVFVKNEDSENGITMLDVLEEENDLENDVIAVLGASDDKNCTYEKGYMKRQALYSCITCIPSQDKFAGVCLACSYYCHEGHNLIELYTKRNFCCDCGNGKFGGNVCKLYPNKNFENATNKYNQNFNGLYCNCHRPYPDFEDDISDEMLQCILCEDWYHNDLIIPKDFGEMICEVCWNQFPVLWFYEYKGIMPNKKSWFTETDDKENIEANTNDKILTNTNCKTKHVLFSSVKGAIFLPADWRNELCTCSQCKILYEKENIIFLLDNEDTIHFYEEQGKILSKSHYDMSLRAFDSLNRISKIEALSEYNKLKDELTIYLKKFVENKKMVREEDITEFFDKMKAHKKKSLSVFIPERCK